jgi:hypothetical protein
VVDGQYLAEARTDRLGKVSCGKSCISVSPRWTRWTDAVASTAEGRNGYTAG